MCLIVSCAERSHPSVQTFLPESVWRVRGVMNRCALAVIRTWTSAPASVRPRTISHALYAAIPPLTPSAIRTGLAFGLGAHFDRMRLARIPQLDGARGDFFLRHD